MVKSKIHKDKINYKEFKTVDEEDIGHSSTLYEYDYNGNLITFALGKEKYTYSSEDVIYYPLYLIINDSPKARIGVFEINSSQLIDIIDEEGDVDLLKGNILFFSFVDIEYIQTMLSKQKPKEIDEEFETLKQKSKKEDTEETEEEVYIDEEQDVMSIKIPKQKLRGDKPKTESGEELFIEDKSTKQPVMLEEETEETSTKIKSQFMESPRTTWIEKFMKNNNYDIVENESNGDCFFAFIRNAFEQVGKKTTIDKLRKILANESTDDIYSQYRTIYLNLACEFQEKEEEMKKLKKLATELRKRNQNTKDKDASQKIIEEAKKVVEEYEKMKLEKAAVKDLLNEFSHMEKLETFENFKEFIQTPNFWADTWAISTMERLLNIKIIILSQEAYDAGDLDSVLKCGQLNDSELEKKGGFKPEFYILTSYNGNHYELITYKNKRLLKFSEIPYDIKAMVINKCMERNSGPYYLIQDFRNFKTKLGLSPDEGNPKLEEEITDYELFDKDIIFVFYAHSAAPPKAGKGSGEKIDEDRKSESNILNRDPKCKDWRRKLDDSWIAPFTLDGNRWASVTHFVNASGYKKGYPDFFMKFSMDSESDISQDVDLANAAASKSGKLKDKILRPSNVKIDPDYYEYGLNTKKEENRRRAIEAKFEQNLDLKKVLMETKDAKLLHFVRGHPPLVDDDLMRLRKKLRTN